MPFVPSSGKWFTVQIVFRHELFGIWLDPNGIGPAMQHLKKFARERNI
jgi:hypothetical protein